MTQNNKYLTIELLESIRNNYIDFNIEVLKSSIILQKVLNIKSDGTTITQVDFRVLLGLFEEMFANDQEVMQLFFEHNIKTHGVDILREIIKGNNLGFLEHLILYQRDKSPINISYFLNSITLEIDPEKNEIFIKLYENNVITKDHVSNLCYNSIKLLDHPIRNICPSNHDAVDTILSSVYSPLVKEDSLKPQLTELFKSSQALNDVMRFTSASILSKPLFIEFVDIRKHNSREVGTRGYMYTLSNQIVVFANLDNAGILMHELTHYSMQGIFLNWGCDPYTSPVEKELFNIAKKNTLSHINDLLLKKFGRAVEFSTTLNSFDFGKNLYDLSFKIQSNINEYLGNGDFFSCLNTILNVYIYPRTQEDKEFIAHYVEAMCNTECPDLLKEITPPMESYWETVVTPKVLAYEHACNINTQAVVNEELYVEITLSAQDSAYEEAHNF